MAEKKSLAGTIELLSKDDTSLKKVAFSEFGLELSASQCDEIATALKSNTNCSEVDLSNCGVDSENGAKFVDVVASNKTIKKLDLGYNKIGGDVMADLCSALAKNCSLEEVKIHRQSSDYGAGNEAKMITLWETNTTLTRLYGTFHDRRCNQTNTAGEVRNKEISRRIAAGKDWMDLDPARKDEWAKLQVEKRKKEEEEKKAANAPITEKVPSTGGPYTLKQLTCQKEFLPDDIEVANKPSYLSDEEFQALFGMDKGAFNALPNWKKLNLKKTHNLH
jgi:hypothetical protein